MDTIILKAMQDMVDTLTTASRYWGAEKDELENIIIARRSTILALDSMRKRYARGETQSGWQPRR